MSTGRVVTVELPTYNHHPHLQSCWRKNLGLEAVILKRVAKVAVARPPCLQKRNIYPRLCRNPLRFLVFDSEPVLHEKSHVPLTKTVVLLLGETANSQLTEVATSSKQLGKMLLPLPNNRYPAACY